MPQVDANGNLIPTLPRWRVTAIKAASPYYGTASWVTFDPLTQGSFRLTEAAELRAFEDGQPVELG